MLNHRPFKKLPGCRHSLFEQLDRPAMKPLPAEPSEWSKARAHIDYHIEVDGHYYSVPYSLVKQTLEVCLSAHTVEIFHKGLRITSHLRCHLKGRHTTPKPIAPTLSGPPSASSTGPRKPGRPQRR